MVALNLRKSWFILVICLSQRLTQGLEATTELAGMEEQYADLLDYWKQQDDPGYQKQMKAKAAYEAYEREATANSNRQIAATGKSQGGLRGLQEDDVVLAQLFKHEGKRCLA